VTGPAVSVFLPSYGKAAFVGDAIGSVLAQDRGDWELWILENSEDGGQTRQAIVPLLGDPRIRYEEISLGPEDRLPNAYPTAVLLNRYYGKAAGEFIAYISDDDTWEPGLLSRCLEEFAAHPEWHAVWFTMWRSAWDGRQGRFRPAGSIPAVNEVGRGAAQERASCRVDGGQVMHRRACLEEIAQPWFPEEAGTAHYCDGLFLQKLADVHPLHPVPDRLMTHRATPLSAWDRPAGRRPE
jgi:glycosyltransferase involved in cell wall biosynthesis